LAILLEVSADKPGNVNLVVGFEGTNHMHFLASAVAAAPHLGWLLSGVWPLQKAK
jgi:triphosphoribosyl-dephospho-CoA synthetase